MVVKYLHNIYSFCHILVVQGYKLYDVVIIYHYFMLRK